jgi:hypothetical protein
MDIYFLYILVIIFLKIIFVILKTIVVYNKLLKKEETETSKTIVYWAERAEFVYTVLMALLLMYLFRNGLKGNKICIKDKETLTLLYLFGFILIFTSNWSVFITESKWFNEIEMKREKKEKERVGYVGGM